MNQKTEFDRKAEINILLFFFSEKPTADRESRLKIFYLEELEKIKSVEKRKHFENIFNQWDNLIDPQKKAEVFVNLWQYVESQPNPPSLSGIPFLTGGREGFLNNLQILTDAGHIELTENKYTVQAVNRAAAHRVVISIFMNAIDRGFIRNFFFKDKTKKIKWLYLKNYFNYRIPGQEPQEFSNVELSKQYIEFFDMFSINLEDPLYNERIIKNFMCEEFLLISAITKTKQLPELTTT